MVEQDTLASAEVLVSVNFLVTPPAKEGTTIAAGHLVAARALLYGHAARWAALRRLLQHAGRCYRPLFNGNVCVQILSG